MNTEKTSVLGQNLWRVLGFARPHRPRLVLGLSANAAARFFDLLPLLVVGRVVDTVTTALREGSSLAPMDFLSAGLLVLGTFAGLALFQSVSDYCLDTAAQQIRHDVRVALYAHVQKLDVSYFESRQTGDIMSVLSGDVDNLERFFSDTASSIVRLVITFVGIYGMLFWLDAHLALLLLAPLPLAIWAVRFFSTRVAPQYRRARRAVGEINAVLENNLQGMPVIQAYSAQDHQVGRVRRRSEEYRDAAMRAAWERARFVPLLYGVAGLGYAVLIGLGGWLTFIGVGPSVGEFTTFVLMAMRLILPLFVFGMLINQLQQSEASALRINEILEARPTVHDQDDARPLVGPVARVEAKELSFAYPVRDRVLCGVSFVLRRGEVLGVVGPTGAGKSSLAKIMLRYHDPSAGMLLVNGRPLAEIALDSWRGRIGYVSQDAYLFHGTVAENIRLGSPSATDDAVAEAARLAGVHECIAALPEGYATLVGDRGTKLSGGQRQRISLARALLRDPEVLILDEATSSVDTQTEEIIQNNLRESRRERLTLAIAHRLSTVRQCEEIVVMVDGVLVERGTHGALVAADGVYAGLWRVQSGERERDK